MHPATPTVIVLEELLRRGWKRGEAPPAHTMSSQLFFGTDGFAARKFYLQCLVALADLCGLGLRRLPSGQKKDFYRAVLASPAPGQVRPDRSREEYAALVGEGGPPAVQVQLLEASGGGEGDESEEEDMPQNQRTAVGAGGGVGDLEPPAEAGGGSSADRSATIPSGIPVGQLVVLGPHAERPKASVPSCSSSSSSDGPPPLVAMLEQGPGDLEPPAEEAIVRDPVHACIKVEKHLRPGMVGHYVRYTTLCPLARCQHRSTAACGKRRNCGPPQFGRLGPAAPEAFLMVWRGQASHFPSREAHQRWCPTEAEVRLFMQDQGWL